MFDWQYEDNMKIPPPNPLGQKKKKMYMSSGGKYFINYLRMCQNRFPSN